ncbi:MAG: hypothetical protein QXV69_03860 [Sulfolobaceae archaeon]
MNNDYETGSDSAVYIEIFFDKNSFRTILNKYRSEKFENWYLIGNPHEMIGKEFDSYSILLYPIKNLNKSFLNIFSEKIREFDNYREVINIPYIWLSSLTFKFVNNLLILGREYKINYFHGIDIISESLNKYGILLKQMDDCEFELAVRIGDIRDKNEVIRGFKLILEVLRIYNRIKREQEDLIIQNLEDLINPVLSLHERKRG